MDEEILEQDQNVDANNMVEPLVIETKGKWQPFEVMTKQTFEIGKTYKINVEGDCMFAISKDRPTSGMGANEITYIKDSENKLWILTK